MVKIIYGNFEHLKAGDKITVIGYAGSRNAIVQSVTKSYIRVDGCRFSKKTGQQIGFIGAPEARPSFLSTSTTKIENTESRDTTLAMRDYFSQFGKVQAIGVASPTEYHVYFEKFRKGIKVKDIPTAYEGCKGVEIKSVKVGRISPAVR